MKALHFAVCQLPTIGESTTEILRVIEGFESVVHFHGTHGKFLQSLGNKKPVIDLGKVIHRFLLPVRKSMKASNALCKIDQAVACVLFASAQLGLEPPGWVLGNAAGVAAQTKTRALAHRLGRGSDGTELDAAAAAESAGLIYRGENGEPKCRQKTSWGEGAP
jgi:hypothetical protein